MTVAALLFTDNGLVIGKRASTSKNSPDLWEVPGGKPERGESPEQTLRRELGEELLLTDVTIGGEHGIFPVTHPYYAYVFYARTTQQPRRVAGVHDEVREVAYANDLPSADRWASGNYAIVQKFLAEWVDAVVEPRP